MSPQQHPPMKVGDHVETMFDTGAMGVTPLHGNVVAAGPKRYTVEWESTLRNRLPQGYHDVRKVEAAGCFCRLAKSAKG